MHKLAKILLFLLIIGCGADSGSKIITSSGEIDPNTGNGNNGGSGGGDGSISDLTVELISYYNDDTASFSTVFGNYTRSFIVHTPPNYDSNNGPLPLLFVLHGYTGQAPSIRNYSGFDSIADEENFIVVYVQGITDVTNTTGWNVDVVSTFNDVDDVGLFAALIKHFKANYNIANDKIFSTGMSLGGFMSYRLACELDEINSLTKKERLNIERQKDKLELTLGGIKNMSGLPDAIFIIDTNKEAIAVFVANNLNIPVIAVCDSNSNPTGVDYPIPGNDDALRAISLYCDLVGSSILQGLESNLEQSGIDIGASENLMEENLDDINQETKELIIDDEHKETI